MVQHRGSASFGKEVFYILCVVVFIVSALFSIFGPGGFKDMRKAQRELEVHRGRVEGLKRTNREKLISIQGLKSDPSALEKYARGKGYAREGEIIQQLPPEPETPAAQQPTAK